MEKRKEFFRKVFRKYISAGLGLCFLGHEIPIDVNWEAILFPGEKVRPVMDFANAFLLYLDHSDLKADDQIILKLKELNKSDSFYAYHACSFIWMLLHTPEGEEFSKLAEGTLLKLHKVFTEQNETTEEFIFLENLVIFISAIYPDFCKQEREEITNAFFCSYAIQAARINELFIPDPTYVHKAFCAESSYVICRTIEAAFEIAMHKPDYQDAYDILYPLFHGKMVGYYADIPWIFSESDLRKPENEFSFVLFKTIMAIHCSGMSDLQRRGSVQHDVFRRKAIGYARDTLHGEIPYSYATYCIPALLNSEEYKYAAKITADMLTTLQKANDHPEELIADVCVETIRSYLGWICSSNLNSGSKWKRLLTTIVYLREIEIGFWEDYTEISESEYCSVLYICKRTKSLSLSKRTNITGLLMCIYHLVQKIKRELWDDSYIQTVYYTREESPDVSAKTTTAKEKQPVSIAYYTTLDNLKYLWEPVYANSHQERPKPRKDFADEKNLPKSKKNCLTMMHAHYMNDPREGIALPDALSDWIDQKSNNKNVLFCNNSPEAFRERLFNNQFVFLKSFTDIIDQLNMWSMYGSDRSDGSDSNGCCVRINPKTFEDMLSISHKTSMIRDLDNDHDTDDLRLYKIAYLKDNELVSPKNDNSKLNFYYEYLREMVQKLNDLLTSDKSRTEGDMVVVTQLLQEILTPIIFLFKDASYRSEHERRLIVTRSRTKEDMESISKTPQDPPKLYVNPYHQVFVDQIILGPKVKQPDNWIPHLQFELAKMWESWPGEKRIPSVRKSSINYRD